MENMTSDLCLRFIKKSQNIPATSTKGNSSTLSQKEGGHFYSSLIPPAKIDTRRNANTESPTIPAEMGIQRVAQIKISIDFSMQLRK